MLSTFSLDAVPIDERQSALKKSFASYALPIDARFTQVGDLAARFASRTVGRVRLERFEVCGVRGTAVRHLTSANSAVEPALTLHALNRGPVDIRHAERASIVRSGASFLSSTDSPLAMAQHDESAMGTITVPMAEARLSRREVWAGLNRPFASSDPVASTAFALLRRLTRGVTEHPDEPWEMLEATLVALTRALVLLGTASARDARQPLAETLTDRVLQYIEEHALDPGLDVTTIAAAHGISARYVYVVLRSRNVVLGHHVRTLRLQHAARILRDPTARTMTVAEIAYLSGFSDHAHFSRSFRREYDVAPTDWRHAPEQQVEVRTTNPDR